jgi:8-oxo-dGTP pyrophosphatase MutT (NUDIX family)
VLLVRDAPELQVLMVKRHHQIEFASGALVFPGGKAEPEDASADWRPYAAGWSEAAGAEQGLKIAGIREAFEESGVLLAQTPQGDPCCASPAAAAERQAVAAGSLSFLALVRSLDLRLDLTALTPFARWITPPITPKRFDTWFFIATAPADQLAACDGFETVDAEWISPGHALALGASGERKVIFPTRMNLRLLAESASADGAIEAARQRPVTLVEPSLEVREGVRVLVLPPDAGYGAVVEPLSEAM